MTLSYDWLWGRLASDDFLEIDIFVSPNSELQGERKAKMYLTTPLSKFNSFPTNLIAESDVVDKFFDVSLV